jgi:hypothetical protein
MGYRSDVVIAFAFKHKAQVDEVMAVYRMDPRVQEHDLEKLWTICEREGDVFVYYAAEHIKWYESYEDVQGLEHMKHVVNMFDEQRGRDEGDVAVFPYAFRFVRIGEEDNDIETDHDENDFDLHAELLDRVTLRRELEHNF